jgi:hypothetical protein
MASTGKNALAGLPPMAGDSLPRTIAISRSLFRISLVMNLRDNRIFFATIARPIVEQAIGKSSMVAAGDDPNVALGKFGGAKGGKERAALSPRKRKASAKKRRWLAANPIKSYTCCVLE